MTLTNIFLLFNMDLIMVTIGLFEEWTSYVQCRCINHKAFNGLDTVCKSFPVQKPPQSSAVWSTMNLEHDTITD